MSLRWLGQRPVAGCALGLWPVDWVGWLDEKMRREKDGRRWLDLGFQDEAPLDVTTPAWWFVASRPRARTPPDCVDAGRASAAAPCRFLSSARERALRGHRISYHPHRGLVETDRLPRLVACLLLGLLRHELHQKKKNGRKMVS